MLWAEDIPVHQEKDGHGLSTWIRIIAGRTGNSIAPPPAPDSWAAEPENQVGIWLVTLEAGASWTIPPASPEINHTQYFYRGESIKVAGINILPYHSVDLLADYPVIVENDTNPSNLLLLQGRPIHEPVVQHSPFVMNTAEEIRQAFTDYRMTRFWRLALAIS